VLYPLELVPGPIYAKEVQHLMLPLAPSWPSLLLFQNKIFVLGIPLHLVELIAITLQGPYSQTGGPKAKMVFLSLTYGVQKLAVQLWPPQPFGFSRQRRECMSALISIGALP